LFFDCAKEVMDKIDFGADDRTAKYLQHLSLQRYM
jgi:hypothetical protein